MEKPTPSYLSSLGRMSSTQMVAPPQRHEGIGNALRSAFEPGNYGLPDDMAKLLHDLEDKKGR